MVFDAFRENKFPTYYDENKTPWEADILTSGLIFAFVILAFSLLIILPGFKGTEKLFLLIRIVLSLFIGGVIVVTLFTQTWEVAETHTKTKYKAGIGKDVNLTIGVNIGLKGVNITLKGDDNQIPGEKIDYNEHFSWNSPQGRLGFGPYAGRFNQEYRAAQFRGLPLPILWVAEYFTIDGEGIRWGRIYRQAGFYAHIMLWLSFPLWILSNVLFFVLLRFGAYMLVLTGLCMLTANIIWGGYRNYVELAIPFTAEDVLDFSFGPSFWVVLFTGIICVILGVIVFLLDKLYPTHIAIFFGVDVLQDSESLIVEEEEDEPVKDRTSRLADSSGAADQEESSDDDELYVVPEPARPQAAARTNGESNDRARAYLVKVPSQSGISGPSFRSSENRLTKRLQRPRRRAPPPRPGSDQIQSPHLASTSSPKATFSGTQPVVEEEEEEVGEYGNIEARTGSAKQEFGQQRQSVLEQGLDNGTEPNIELKNFQSK
ncbi:dual oxidase maturation factor 1 [Plakobranchus ocellatus]|uniref:Dual oxidase maturation factor 1 n=1 Tax=Plakobranchus ocellatus TaxID=259542 RepID=A0AAV4BW96_9GAST|nr:dual oxidase maturation factor 1 [Plakobranchus ocellatus]